VLEKGQMALWRDAAHALRFLSADAVERAGSGHPGMPMGFADVLMILARDFLHIDPDVPHWLDRDRVILSAGHGSMALYSLAYLLGYKDMDIEQLKNFRQLGARTAGHPERGMASIVETTTGPLSHGLGNGVGCALAERLLAQRWGRDLVDHDTYVIVGDGCLMEGLSHEACALAGHWGLGRLIVLFDDNGVTIDGETSLATSEDIRARLQSYGWHVMDVDGYDEAGIHASIHEARGVEDRPSFIALRTTIGFGASSKAGTCQAHGSPLGAQALREARRALSWPHEPFTIPEEIMALWRSIPARAQKRRKEWEARLASHKYRDDFMAMMGMGHVEGQGATASSPYDKALHRVKRHLGTQRPSWATRRSSQDVLSALIQEGKTRMDVPLLIGGSADLSGSNGTYTEHHKVITKGDMAGNYLHYGVREHGMASIMNGLSVHGGIIPYGGTFLVFSDYMKAGIRLSALMGCHVIYVMTHDSIGVGEDGPTHQPVEHMIGLRSIPNLYVFRPADGVEVVECWQLALSLKGASVLVLSRQKLEALRAYGESNLSRAGGYIMHDSEGSPLRVVLLSSGSELQIAVRVRERLQREGIGCRVVSMPCWRLFDALDEEERVRILGEGCMRVAVEAAGMAGWERYTLGHKSGGGDMLGMEGFGASAPGPDVYKHCAITDEALYRRVHALLAHA